MSNANQNSSQNYAHQQPGKEQIDTAAAPANMLPSGFQAIATAYGDYTKRSFEDTKSFVEKMSAVRSLDKAIEVQTEFAKTALRDIRNRVTEDWRTVRRSRQTVVQAIRWLCRKDDPDKSIGL